MVPFGPRVGGVHRQLHQLVGLVHIGDSSSLEPVEECPPMKHLLEASLLWVNHDRPRRLSEADDEADRFEGLLSVCLRFLVLTDHVGDATVHETGDTIWSQHSQSVVAVHQEELITQHCAIRIRFVVADEILAFITLSLFHSLTKLWA